MRARISLLIIIPLIEGLVACKKDKHPAAPSIVGKWQVTKIEKRLDWFAVLPPVDTIYTGSAVNASDYFQFYGDNTAKISASGEFGIYAKATKTDDHGNPVIGTNQFRYTIAGSPPQLTTTLIDPNAVGTIPLPATEEIVELDAHNLILKQVETEQTHKLTTEINCTR